jgi:hypothetical protein
MLTVGLGAKKYTKALSAKQRMVVIAEEEKGFVRVVSAWVVRK